MPNWCYNRLSVRGEKTDEFISAVTNEFGNIQILETLYPIPEGVEDWYSWSVTNWGTKWPDREARTYEEKGWQVFSFDTAWSPPLAGIKAISAMFPTESFVIVYEEGGMCFMGGSRFERGVEVFTVSCPYPDGPEDPENPSTWDDLNDEVFSRLEKMESYLRRIN